MTKVKACEGANQVWKLGVTFHAPRNVGKCERMNFHTAKWTSILRDGKMESQWIPKFSENNCKGQNPMDCKVHYIIGKILKRRCSKWARMTHLDNSNTTYGQKKGRESNWRFDSRPLKVGNRPNFLACRWRVTYHWKAINEGYNFASNLISLRGLHAKLWGPKVAGVPTLGILKLPNGHLDVSLVERHIVYYKGEGDGFTQVQTVVNLVNLNLPVARPSTKSALINLLFGFVQVRVSD
jgi:hypothetical protein